MPQNAALRSPHPDWHGGRALSIVESAMFVQPIRSSMTLRQGDNLGELKTSDIAIVESGCLSLDLTTAAGMEFCLSKLGPGAVVVPVDAIVNPAFSLTYRSDAEATRVTWQRHRSPMSGHVTDSERTMLAATTELLGACIRIVHDIACLPAPQRLYCELLRIAARQQRDGATARFVLPTHSIIAARLCTTRETISRELSFLRRNGVIAPGKHSEILKPAFLTSRIARTLNLTEPADLWRAIGITGN